MAHSKEIESAVDSVAGRWKGLGKKPMFGGVCYLLRGNMCFGVYREFLIVRAGPEMAAKWLGEKDVLPFDITGRPMKGWVMLAEGRWRKAGELKTWLEAGKKFALGLPAKGAGAP